MKRKFRDITIVLSVMVITLISFFIVDKSFNEDNSISKIEKLPFLENVIVNYGGFKITNVSDITNTDEALDIEKKLSNNWDYLTMLKVEVNVDSSVDKLSDISFLDLDNNKYDEFSYYFKYNDLEGTDKDKNKLIGSIDKNSKIIFYIVPNKELEGNTYKLNFTFSDNNVLCAYTEFALYRIKYVDGKNSFNRYISSYADSFKLDKVLNKNFLGWTDKLNAKVKYSNEELFEKDKLEEFINNRYDITLYSVKNKEKGEGEVYHINYTANGAIGTVDPLDVTAGNSFVLSDNGFTKIGSTFLNWAPETLVCSDYSDWIGGHTVNVDTLIPKYVLTDNNINLYPCWKYIDYTISYDGNGSNVTGSMNNSVFNYEPKATYATINIRENGFSRSGYTFAGFSLNREGTGTRFSTTNKPKASDLGAKNVTLYAIWETQTVNTVRYTVKYDAADGTGTMADDYVNSNEQLTLKANGFTKENATFNGWKNGNNVYDENEKITDLSELEIDNNTITFVAVWKSNKGYNITFNSNGGTGTMANVTVNEGDSAQLPSNSFERVGYKFGGWLVDPKDDRATYQNNGVINSLDEDLDLYALWIPITYKIIYDANDNSGSETGVISGSMNDTNATYDENVKLRKNAYVHNDSDYVFSGWATTPNGNVDYLDEAVVTNLSDEEYDEITLYAIWVKKISFKISFNKNGGNGKMEELNTKTYTDTVLLKNSFKKDGYSFIGWSTQENGDKVYDDGQTINLRQISGDELILYAVWKKDVKATNNISKNSLTNPETRNPLLIILLTITICFVARFVYSRRKGY